MCSSSITCAAYNCNSSILNFFFRFYSHVTSDYDVILSYRRIPFLFALSWYLFSTMYYGEIRYKIRVATGNAKGRSGTRFLTDRSRFYLSFGTFLFQKLNHKSVLFANLTFSTHVEHYLCEQTFMSMSSKSSRFERLIVIDRRFFW